MANTLTPIDVYGLVNLIAAQATGQTAITATDTSTFVSVGETLLRTGAEKTLNAISTVLADTIFSIRPYQAKLSSLNRTQRRWGAQVRKIVNLYSPTEESQDYNTDINPTQLADGASIDHYTIKNPLVLQLNFYGTKKLQKHITRHRDQLALAFSSEDEFIRFIDSIMTEFGNEIELANEEKSRACLLNYIAGLYDMSQAVDLVAAYNAAEGFSPALSRSECLSEAHIEGFMKFVASTIKIYSDRMTDYTANYHASISGYNSILRHTPKDRQKMIMYSPIFTKMKTEVYSTLFNPEYLNIGEFEGVNFWQSQDYPEAIKIYKPNILDTSTGQSADGADVDLDFVLGVLFDDEAIGVTPQFDYSATTPFNAAGGYANIYYHWRFNSYNDFTENGILFYLGA